MIPQIHAQSWTRRESSGRQDNPASHHLDFEMAREAGLYMPPASWNMLSWNCRGLGKTDGLNFLPVTVGLNFLLGLVRTRKPNVIFLTKTKCKNGEK